MYIIFLVLIALVYLVYQSAERSKVELQITQDLNKCNYRTDYLQCGHSTKYEANNKDGDIFIFF
jgi:hypothetical protein